MELTTAIANETALFAMMSSNTYLDGDRTMFPIEDLGWIKVDEKGRNIDGGKNSYSGSIISRLFSGLEFDIWEHEDGKTTVFAYKGTDEKIDWVANLNIGVAIPYKSAKKRLKRYMRRNPDRSVVVTGHSLGGGICLSMCLWLNVKAYAFNSSPRVFDGLGDRNSTAKRVAIYQAGDILGLIRDKHPKFHDVMKGHQIIETKFDFGGRNRHRIDYLAEGLLACSTEEEHIKLAEKLGLNVACYL